MLNRRETLMALGALALSRPVRAQDRQTSNDDDLRKFGAAMDFSRTRKSADYAISTPTAIRRPGISVYFAESSSQRRLLSMIVGRIEVE